MKRALIIFLGLSLGAIAQDSAVTSFEAFQTYFYSCINNGECPLDCFSLAKNNIRDWFFIDGQSTEKIKTLIDKVKADAPSNAKSIWISNF